MDERTNGQRKMNGDGNPWMQGHLDGVHASENQLNALIDGGLAGEELASVEGHVATCEECQLQLAELRGMVAMLRALPEPRLRRSFQLGPEHLKDDSSAWSKLAAWLLPTLPALRAMTVAVALLLAAVSIRNVVEEPAERAPQSDFAAQQAATMPTMMPTQTSGQNTAGLATNQQPTQTTAESEQVLHAEPEGSENRTTAAFDTQATEAPVEAAEAARESETASDAAAPEMPDAAIMVEEAPEGADETGQAPGAAASKQPADSAAGASAATRIGDEEQDGEIASDSSAADSDDETSANEDIAMAAAAPEASPIASPSASPSPSPSPSPTPTATPTATATATPPPTATATPEPAVATSTTTNSQRDGWEIAQLALAVALLGLIGLLFADNRIRRHRRF